jgi:cell shape-determining protein MreD
MHTFLMMIIIIYVAIALSMIGASITGGTRFTTQQQIKRQFINCILWPITIVAVLIAYWKSLPPK